MNQGQYVFSQLMAFLSHNDFIRYVKKYKGNYKVKTLTCWHQFLCMTFGQLSRRESLSDLVICLQSLGSKSYHLGVGKAVSKAALAKANENRDYRIYESFANDLVSRVQRLSIDIKELDLPFDAPVYAIDATVVDLCLNVFWWGKFRKHKAAAKIHVVFEVKTNIPTFVDITSGAIHEVNVLDIIAFDAGSYYTMDKAYIDFGRLYFIHQCGAFFVTRAKSNFRFVRIKSSPVDKSTGIICDQIIRLKNQKVSMAYPEQLRRIKYYDQQEHIELVFITNDFEIDAIDIVKIYKYRWTIEIFFRWIKQHLKIKTFWGHSLNAVKTQIYIAIITYLLVAIVKHTLKLKQTQYEILQVLSVSLLCKTSLSDLFENDYPQYVKEQLDKQLKLFK